MRHLIVGCGYLGQRVARLWQHDGDTVFAMTRSPQRAESWRSEGLQPIVADVCEPATLTRLPEVDTLLWAVGFDRASGRSQESVYVDGLRNVLSAIHDRCRRVLYVSSSSVYGQQEGELVDEDSPCEPTQPGGRCCLAAEQLLAESSRVNRQWLPVILRLTGIYGPQRLLSRVESLRNGDPLSGSPDAWLNLVYVEDAARVVQAAATHSAPSERYLVTDDRPVLRGEYYSALAQLVGAPPPRFDESLASRRGSGGRNKRCSNQRVKAELGITFQFPDFNQGLQAVLAAGID